MSHSQSLVGGFKHEFYGKITMLNGKSTINGSCSTINGYIFLMFHLYGMSSGTHFRSPSFFKMVIAPPTRCEFSIFFYLCPRNQDQIFQDAQSEPFGLGDMPIPHFGGA